jgi:hypothetical protein
LLLRLLLLLRPRFIHLSHASPIAAPAAAPVPALPAIAPATVPTARRAQRLSRLRRLDEDWPEPERPAPWTVKSGLLYRPTVTLVTVL